jgi:hypothetical protein
MPPQTQYSMVHLHTKFRYTIAIRITKDQIQGVRLIHVTQSNIIIASHELEYFQQIDQAKLNITWTITSIVHEIILRQNEINQGHMGGIHALDTHFVSGTFEVAHSN